MKKIVMLMAAAVAAFGISSCSKELEETTTQEEAKELILDITVAYFDGSADTRAVKKDWEVGDRINIWFDHNEDITAPDLVIRYDGESWHRDAKAHTSGKLPGSSHSTFVYLYEGFNDLSKYTYASEEGTSGIPSTANLMYRSDDKDWHYYDYSDGVLSLAIDSWLPASEFQVVIPGIDPANYVLKCDQMYSIDGIFNLSGWETGALRCGMNYYTYGVENADGAAYYFTGLPGRGKDIPTSDFVFYLKNTKTGAEYYYVAEGKSHKGETFTAIKLDLSKFLVNDDSSAEVNIPDPAFRAYCLENFDKNHDYKLSEAEAALVTEINASGLGIESLEGLQYFTSLCHLHCNNNMLTSLDVSNNLQLECIECIGTNDYKLSSLDLTKNTKLTSLRLNNNNLTDLDVTKNTRLDYLTLSGNPLSSSIDLSQNVWLKTLSLYNCSLPYIDLSKTIRLNHIDLRRNKLTTLDISHIGLGDTWRSELIEQFWCEDNPDLKEIIVRRTQYGFSWSNDSGVKITRIDI